MRIKYLLTVMVFLTALLSAKLPIVLTKVGSKKIDSGEDLKVAIVVRAVNGAVIEFPDIKNIGGFGIKDKREKNLIATVKIDGKDTKVVTKTEIYTITPTKNFKIPAYDIVIDSKHYKTNSIVVEVKKKRIVVNNGGYIFKMSSNKRKVAVGETFIVDVSLIEPIDASSAKVEYIPPKFKGFEASPMGDGEIIDKGDSVVRNIKYLVTPKRSGSFTIKPATAKIGMQVTSAQAQSPFGFFGADIQWKKIASNSLNIKVSELPQGVEAVGDYKIEAKVDKVRVSKNKPVNLTLTIKGEGNLDNITDPEIKIDNVTVYGDDSNIEHRFENGKIYSKYVKHYAIIGSKDFTIPAISIKAYSSKKRKVYTLSTKPITIKVAHLKNISSILHDSGRRTDKFISTKNSISELSKPEKSVDTVKKIESILIDKDYYKKLYSGGRKKVSFYALFLALVLGVIAGAIIATYIPVLLRKKRIKAADEKLYGSYEEALSILYPHIMEDAKAEEMVKDLYEVTSGNREIKINDKALNKLIKKVTEGKAKVCK